MARTPIHPGEILSEELRKLRYQRRRAGAAHPCPGQPGVANSERQTQHHG